MSFCDFCVLEIYFSLCEELLSVHNSVLGICIEVTILAFYSCFSRLKNTLVTEM